MPFMIWFNCEELHNLFTIKATNSSIVRTRRFQATGTPMAKILRLHLNAQCVLREITILYNFAIEKVEKNILLQRFRDLKTLFQNCFKIV
jgi:hypothetical protein